MSDGRTVRMDGIEVNTDELSWREFHKNPVQIEATPMPAQFTVETLEGTMQGDSGDILIRGVKGELYPCDADIFYQTYIADETEVPQYTENDLQELASEFRDRADKMERTTVGNVAARELRQCANQLEELLDE